MWDPLNILLYPFFIWFLAYYRLVYIFTIWKKNIYSEIKFMSVWYFLLHSIFHISLLVILCNFICHFWICIQVVRYASSVKKATIYYIVTWCTRCNCFCGRSVVFRLVNLHSLSRVAVPATLHNISVNAHFTRFL
jgi:hypothetical protein